MKLYIIITPTVSDMGGAQNYFNCKKHWFEENGWDGKVVCNEASNIILKSLHTNILCFNDILYPTYFYSYRKRNSISEKIIKTLDAQKYSEILIESTTINISTWGEMIASCLKCRHLVFTLQEDNPCSNKSLAAYLEFKYDRHEIAGISPSSIPTLMNAIGVQCQEGEQYTLDACNGGIVEDYEHEIIHTIESIPHDYVICSIGRIEKPFVYPTMKSLVDYISSDTEHSYIVLLIGDAPASTNHKADIKKLCETASNLTLIITGYMHPIPLRLLRLCDISLSSSGSAAVSHEAGIPTVSIDGSDYKPIGVVGYTTNNRLFREDEPILALSQYLDEILKQHKYNKTEPKMGEALDYTSHLNYISNSASSLDYFDVNKLAWNKNQKVQSLLVPLLGPHLYHSIIQYVKK